MKDTRAPAGTGADLDATGTETETASETAETNESATDANTSTEEAATDSETSTEAKTFTHTQVELDKLVNEARAKVKKQFAGYDEYKAKAETVDGLTAQLTTLQGALIARSIDSVAQANDSTLKGEHLAKLLDLSAVQVDENGAVTGADDVVSAFLASNPEYVASKEAPASTPGVGNRNAGESNPPKGDLKSRIAAAQQAENWAEADRLRSQLTAEQRKTLPRK